MTLRFIHASEPRLDAPVEDTGLLPEPIAATVRDASLAAFDRMVEFAVAEQVTFVLLTGEIGAGHEHGLRAAFRLRDGLTRLAERGVRVVLALEGEDDERLSPPLSELIESGTDSVILLRRDMPPVGVTANEGTFATIGWVRSTRDAAPAGRPGPLRTGLVPSDFSGDPVGDFDYVARTGRRDYAVEDESPLIVSPGTLQGRGFSPDELGAKGALLISVDEHRMIDHEFVPLDVVRFVSVEQVVDDSLSEAEVARSLLARLDVLRSFHAGSPLILQAVLDIRTGHAFPGGWPAMRDEVLSSLRDASAGFDPFAWWAGVRHRYQSPPAWGQGQADRPDDFARGVLDLASRLIAEPSRRARLIDAQASGRQLDALLQTASARQILDEVREQATGSSELVRDAAELAIEALLEKPRDGQPR